MGARRPRRGGPGRKLSRPAKPEARGRTTGSILMRKLPNSPPRLTQAVLLALAVLAMAAATNGQAQAPGSLSQLRDGAHDFDWEIGAWATSLRYLANPLSRQPDRWIEYQ